MGPPGCWTGGNRYSWSGNPGVCWTMRQLPSGSWQAWPVAGRRLPATMTGAKNGRQSGAGGLPAIGPGSGPQAAQTNIAVTMAIRRIFRSRLLAQPGTAPSRTTSLPKLRPCSSPINAAGARSRPSTMSSRYLISPLLIKGAAIDRYSAKRRQ